MNKQAPHETFRGQMISSCVAAGIDMGMDRGMGRGDTIDPAVVAGFMAVRLDRYIEMLEGLVDGEDLIRVQALIAERYRAGGAEA